MNNKTHRGLLPNGLGDTLPPEAEFEAQITETLMASFTKYGYERVKPPLIEFEDVLLSGSGKKMAKQTFRMMDPISQRMLGVRADMTLQIARIASTRLADISRPIRLSYAGQVLRVKGSALRPKRQFGQIGIEVIGTLSPQADAEIILVSAQALTCLGITDLSIDLCLPTLIPAICKSLNITSPQIIDRLSVALDHKDIPAIEIIEKEILTDSSKIFSTLLRAVGPVDKALNILKEVILPENAINELNKLSDIICCLKDRAPNLTITIDPVETRGYKYHTGVTFTFFALNVRGELGRGGRYLVDDVNKNKMPEPATGASLYLDTILRALPTPKKRDRVLVSSSSPEIAKQLREEGWITVEDFDERDLNDQAHHKKSGCTHVWNGNKVVPIANS